jgi:hypothetical protein
MDQDRHDPTHRKPRLSQALDTAIGQQLLLPDRRKYLPEIIDIDEQFE